MWYGSSCRNSGHPSIAANEILDRAGFDRFCESVAPASSRETGAAVIAARPVFPHHDDRLLRRTRQRARHRVASGRFAHAAAVSSIGLDEKTPDHVTISRTRRLIDGNSSASVHRVLEVGAGRVAEGQDHRHGFDNAGSERGHEVDRAPRYGRKLPGLSEAAGDSRRVDAEDAAALRRMDRKRKKDQRSGTQHPQAEIPKDAHGRPTKRTQWQEREPSGRTTPAIRQRMTVWKQRECAGDAEGSCIQWPVPTRAITATTGGSLTEGIGHASQRERTEAVKRVVRAGEANVQAERRTQVGRPCCRMYKCPNPLRESQY